MVLSLGTRVVVRESRTCWGSIFKKKKKDSGLFHSVG